ncbi:MAG: M20/M25/M40 family metallo-hydrolase [Planctomycetota bacterium]|nr:M20/M25/M40 family metallo-hydrolase [Planctomycetota bacterium]
MLHESHKKTLIDDLCALIRLPSRSFPSGGEEGESQRWLAAKMRAAGARVRTFEPADVPGFLSHPLCCGPDRNYKNRPTVIAEIGPADAPALLVAAHSDTVPIFDYAAWTFSPFLGEVRDGQVRGLGCCDDKWGVATMLTLIRAFMAGGKPLKKRIIFASTIDEEHGVGNGLLLLALAGVTAEAGIYLDGMDMSVFIGNSGGSNLYLRPKRPIDPALFERDAHRLAAACAALSVEREKVFQRPYFEHSSIRHSSVRFVRREDGHGPFFLIAFYTVPGEAREEICARLERGVAEALGPDAALYDLSYREPWFEPALIDARSSIVGLMADAAESVLGRPPVVGVVSKQDVFVLHNHARIPTVSFGVVSSESPRTYHQPDESVAVEDVWAGAKIAHEAVRRWMEA